QPSADLQAAAEELGVTHALVGNMAVSGDRYRIWLRLIGKDETRLWGEQFEGELATTDVFELQDRVAEKVSGALAGTLPGNTPPESLRAGSARRAASTSRGTTDPAAQRHYWEGRDAWLGRTDLERALDEFGK